MSSLLAAAALVALFPPSAQAGSVPEQLAGRFPGVEAENVRPTGVEGLWEVSIGPQVFYLSTDGRFMLRGSMVDLMTGENLTDARVAERQAAIVEGMIDRLDEAQMIVFSPREPKHTVTVFTDIDCTYCRRFHREIEQYTSRGIKVRYMFYPLGGVGSQGWAKADAVWCSPNRPAALTRAKLGAEVTAPGDCKGSPVAAHYEIAQELGITGTPAILTERGEVLRGAVPADRLAAWLEA